MENPEQMDPYGFHEMLVELGKKYLPQRHEVLSFDRAIDRPAWVSRVIVTEFGERGFQAPINIDGWQFMQVSGKGALRDLLRLNFEIAFGSLKLLIDRTWDHEVIPAEVPAGE